MIEPTTLPVVRRRPTVKDVAELADASPSTTSRVLGGHGYASSDVRARVLAAAEQLGYVPDATARSLRKQQSRSVGVIVSDLRNTFYADLAAGVSAAAKPAGFTMMLIDDNGSESAELDAARALVEMRAAGAIVTPLTTKVTTYLRSHAVPAVEADRTFNRAQCDYVVTNNQAVVREVVSQLTALGHRQVALFVDQTRWTTGRERLDGYEQALLEAGITLDPALVVEAGWDAWSARRAAVELLRSQTRPTAVFAVNNLIAEGVWRAAGDLHLRVPDDLSLVSFDSSQWMSMVSPGITAIEQDAFAMGRRAFELLLRRIANPDLDPQAEVVSASVVQRSSIAARAKDV